MAFNLAVTSVQETVRHISRYLDEVTGCSQALISQAQNPSLHERQSSLTLFHARSVPTIDLETYISRIVKYCPCGSEVFLGLVVYLQQMIDMCAHKSLPFSVDAYSIHRLVITGVTVGSKWFSDVFYTNSRYAKVGGLPVSELNTLEVCFLSMVDFDLNVQPEVLQNIGTDLFCGRLPKLVNYNGYQALKQNYSPGDASPHMQLNYNPGADYSQPQQAYRKDHSHALTRGQRALRHMSYPGPSGVCYSTPYVDKCSESAYHEQKQMYGQAESQLQHHRQQQSDWNGEYCKAGYQIEQQPTSRSTLASSSPGDTTDTSTHDAYQRDGAYRRGHQGIGVARVADHAAIQHPGYA